MSNTIGGSTSRNAPRTGAKGASPPVLMSTGGLGRLNSDATALPHCSAESRHRRRGIAPSGLHAVVPPASGDVPASVPRPAPPPAPAWPGPRPATSLDGRPPIELPAAPPGLPPPKLPPEQATTDAAT